MHPKQAIALGVRLFVIWLALRLLLNAPFLLETLHKNNTSDTMQLVLVGVVCIISIAVCLALWNFPFSIARILLPAPEANNEAPQVPDEWFFVGCNLIALYFLGSSISSLIPNLFLWLPKGSFGGDVFFSYVLRDVLTIIIALVLLFTKQGILKLIRYTRTPDE
jgi:hypothetical protein